MEIGRSKYPKYATEGESATRNRCGLAIAKLSPVFELGVFAELVRHLASCESTVSGQDHRPHFSDSHFCKAKTSTTRNRAVRSSLAAASYALKPTP